MPSDLAAATIASMNPGTKRIIAIKPTKLNVNFKLAPLSVANIPPNATLNALNFFVSVPIFNETVGTNAMMSARSASTAAPRAIHL